jgi:hypothetical protein
VFSLTQSHIFSFFLPPFSQYFSGAAFTQTFLLEGEFPLMDLVGIAAGHVYYVLYSTKRLWVPGFLTAAFRNNAYLRKRYAAVSADFAMEGG